MFLTHAEEIFCATAGLPGADGMPGHNGTDGIPGLNGLPGADGKRGKKGKEIMLTVCFYCYLLTIPFIEQPEAMLAILVKDCWNNITGKGLSVTYGVKSPNKEHIQTHSVSWPIHCDMTFYLQWLLFLSLMYRKHPPTA